MTTFTSLTPLGGGESISGTTSSVSSGVRGAAITSTEVLGTLRVKTGATTFVDLDVGAAETDTLSDGQGHVVNRLYGSAETDTISAKGQGVKSAFPPMITKLANKRIAQIQARFLPMATRVREPTVTPQYAVSSASFIAPVSAGRMLNGTLIQGHASFLALVTKAANKPYASVHASFAPMRGRASEGLGKNLAVWYEFVSVAAKTQTVVNYTVIIQETFSLATTSAPQTAYTDIILSVLKTGENYSSYARMLQQINEALVVASVLIKEPIPAVWVLNQVNNASSSYQNFNFNSLGLWLGKHYGADETGIFLLDGYDDAGVRINAAIETGKDDFGSHNKQTIPNVYIGGNTTSPMNLTVRTDDGQENTYHVPAVSQLHNERAVLGKGLRSRYWQFILANTEGAHMEIDTIDFDVATINRRLR